MSTPLSLGLDIGSTTVKAVVLDGDTTLFADYRRHHADVRREVRQLLADIATDLPDRAVVAAVTGSGGLQVAEMMGVGFVQEVVAATEVIERRHPEADVVIELGGEDAKITYLKPTPEQRMNGTCAGGTGAFIDQMATLLRTDASGLDALAAGYHALYPIASRCGVFAKSDVQPLLNQGAAHADIAASVFQAVATQTIAGLACGRPIRGNLILLGGPLHFLPQLRAAYQRALAGQVETFTTPANAQLYVAMGAALLAGGAPTSPAALVEALDRHTGDGAMVTPALRPLFADAAERAAFEARHARASVRQGDLAGARGPLFLGLDAGSTTLKCVLLDSGGQIVFSHYAGNEGDPVPGAVAIIRHVREQLPADAFLARCCVTGYGEGLLQAALRIDEGVIETMAHYRAADQLAPGVTSVIDIGGQDMKYLTIKDGVVDSIAVNEACSSGCGSFLQTFAETMGTDVRAFARAALDAGRPVDLGSRCTVFMNSSVKQAQKEGAAVGDISAGLSYSVVRNALYKVIKLRSADQLGERVVVQGGTFLNDAVLRAFELLTGREVVRPGIAGLMGAFGAALTARRAWRPGESTSLLELDELDDFAVTTERRTCKLCQNHCGLTVSHFPDGSRHVSGNRCERGASTEARPAKSEIPNLYDYKYQRVFGYRRLTDAKATRGTIGIPRVLNMYENYPLWFTILSALKFKVAISGRSNHELFEKGMESIPSENVCYPAKLAHGHVEWLLDKGITTIFYPCVSYEQKAFEASDNHFNCPVVAFYPQVIEKNLDRLREPGVRYLAPFVNLANPGKLAERLAEIFENWGVTVEEAREAVRLGFAEDAAAKADIAAEGQRALEYMVEHGRRGIVLAGRPYHVDPEINHGIPEMITQLGMVVLSEDAVASVPRLERPLRVRDQWSYHARLYEAAGFVRGEPAIQLVQLNSFGCGLDAVTTDQVQEILEAADDVYTVLKIDEMSNLGAARIRLRSLAAATAERRRSAEIITYDPASIGDRFPVFDKAARRTHTLYAPQMAPIHFRLIVPALRRAGYDVRLLEHASAADVEVGLRYVNNDVCYPAIMVIGQLINAFLDGGADPDSSSVMITQTGGMCRATNYAGMLRKGLKDAGFAQVPVLAVSAQGLEESPGFKLTPAMLHRVIQAVVVGDVLQTVLLRTRPYEAAPGSAQELYEKWDAVAAEFFEHGGWSQSLHRVVTYRWLIDRIVAEFDALPLLDVPRRPRVGLVGEILVKFQPDANNDAVRVIEREGCEAALPGLLEFFMMNMTSAGWRQENLGLGSASSVRLQQSIVWLIEQYHKPARQALARTGTFAVPHPIAQLAQRAESIISLGTTAGEGWLLVAEMMELIEDGCPNIIVAQPFACLPNHVVGKGVFRELRRLYPQANVVSIDYDPGASEVNQLNRIKLMVATAHKNAGRIKPEPAGPRTLSITPLRTPAHT